MPIADSTVIRRATLADAADLAHLGAATFTETFGHLYPPEDLQLFLKNNHTESSWQNTLSDTERATWVAISADGTKIGFIAVGKCKLPIASLEQHAGEVHQLYVLSQFHNLRLGTRLMDVGLEWLEAQNKSPLYVGVWSENYGAQRLYERYGFTKVGEYGFEVGSTVDREFILRH